MRRDLVAGFAAIGAVLVVSIRAAIVGTDLRVVFATSMLAFFVAGVVRGSAPGSLAFRALVISSPGLLGTAALIVNDGLSRWPIPLAISIASYASAALGVQCRRMRSAAAGIASGAALAVMAIVLVPPLVTMASAKSGSMATAPFALRTADGQLVRSDALRGRVVVLASWTTWCLPCRFELPELDRAARRFAGDPRVAFLAVNRAERPQRAARYLETSRLALPLAFEEAGFAEALHAEVLPTVVILDRAGRTRFVHYGYDASEHLEERVARTVRELMAE